MWQTDISVGIEYSLDEIIKKYLDDNKIKYTYMRAYKRDIFSIADKNIDIGGKVRDIVLKILLVDVKHQYIMDIIGKRFLTGVEELLIAEMLFFDNDFERDTISDMLTLQYEYSIDGLFNFKMAELRNSWDYLAELFMRVYGSEEDEMILLRYIHDSVSLVGAKIYLTEKDNKPYIFSMGNGAMYDNISLFEDRKKNILYTLVSTHTNEIFVAKEYKFDIDREVISRVASVEFV